MDGMETVIFKWLDLQIIQITVIWLQLCWFEPNSLNLIAWEWDRLSESPQAELVHRVRSCVPVISSLVIWELSFCCRHSATYVSTLDPEVGLHMFQMGELSTSNPELSTFSLAFCRHSGVSTFRLSTLWLQSVVSAWPLTSVPVFNNNAVSPYPIVFVNASFLFQFILLAIDFMLRFLPQQVTFFADLLALHNR